MIPKREEYLSFLKTAVEKLTVSPFLISVEFFLMMLSGQND
jgi:hypothetical protein